MDKKALTHEELFLKRHYRFSILNDWVKMRDAFFPALSGSPSQREEAMEQIIENLINAGFAVLEVADYELEDDWCDISTQDGETFTLTSPEDEPFEITYGEAARMLTSSQVVVNKMIHLMMERDDNAATGGTNNG